MNPPVLDEVIQRYGDWEAPELTLFVAEALVDKAKLLRRLGRHTECQTILTEFDLRYLVAK